MLSHPRALALSLATFLAMLTPALGLARPAASAPASRASSSGSLSTASALSQGEEEILKEFKKYFKKYKDSPSRVEAVRALEGVESVAAVQVLLPLLKDEDPEVVRAAVGILSSFQTRPPIDALLVELSEEKNEETRVGLLKVLTQGGYKGTSEVVAECLSDRAWSVRRQAVRALTTAGETDFLEPIEALRGDKESAVRCVVLQAILALKSTHVVAYSIEALQDDTWQVRSVAIHSLGEVRSRDSIEPLIGQMSLEEGRLVADAAQALENITGRAFGERVALWQRFWDQNKERYQIPSDEEMVKLRAIQAARRAEYEKAEGMSSYHGIETPSRSMLFVIDVSGSMEHEVREKERFKDGDYPSYSRMDIVKTELARTVANLESYVEFNILAFATDVKRWKKTLVPANVLNKSSADSWIKRLEPIGGESKSDLARLGLTQAANLEGGKTNTYGALAEALGLAGKGAKADEYEIEVDTIFFLSDGRPTHGTYTDPQDILRSIGEANELRRVVIHTIAIGDFNKTFMELLAKENGGVFIDLGK